MFFNQEVCSIICYSSWPPKYSW